MIPNLLAIAGLDPSGGAGVAADLKTFAALGCHGMAVVTALTAQNTQGVKAVHLPPADFAAAQIDAIFEDIEVAAVKIGMVACEPIIEALAERLAHYKPRFIVLDPVLYASSGDALSTSEAAAAIAQHLFPLATLITPNLAEAARLCGNVTAPDHEGMRRAAMLLHARGARAVLVTGGDLPGTRRTISCLTATPIGFFLLPASRRGIRMAPAAPCPPPLRPILREAGSSAKRSARQRITLGSHSPARIHSALGRGQGPSIISTNFGQAFRPGEKAPGLRPFPGGISKTCHFVYAMLQPPGRRPLSGLPALPRGCAGQLARRLLQLLM